MNKLIGMGPRALGSNYSEDMGHDQLVAYLADKDPLADVGGLDALEDDALRELAAAYAEGEPVRRRRRTSRGLPPRIDRVAPSGRSREAAALYAEASKILVECKKAVGQVTAAADERIRAEKFGEAEARLRELVRQGKVEPGELEPFHDPAKGGRKKAGLLDLAKNQDWRTVVERYTENGREVAKTAYDLFFEHLENRTPREHFGEITTGADALAEGDVVAVARKSAEDFAERQNKLAAG